MHTSSRDMGSSLVLGFFGVVVFIIAWEVIGKYGLLGLTWPPFSLVLQQLLDQSKHQLFARAAGTTLYSLASGYGIGLISGILIATVAHLIPSTKAGVDNYSAFLHAIPSIALAPLFMVFLGQEKTPAALAALSTFFVMYVTTSSSFASSKKEWGDLFHVFGSSRWTKFILLDFISAIPIICGGMRLAVPSALVGVIVGEWFGSTRGLGVLIVNAMQNFQIPLLWSAVVLTSVISISIYSVFGLVQNAATQKYR